MEAQKKKEAATKAVKLQEEKDKSDKERSKDYQTTNTLSKKFLKQRDAITVLAHHDLMFLHFYVVIVLCPYVSYLLQSYVPTLLCFYCKLNQDELPPHILTMIDGSNKRQKQDLIKELFVKGKNGLWETDTSKPIFKQELTLGACYTV